MKVRKGKKTSKFFLPSLFFISCTLVYIVVARHLLKSTGRKDAGDGGNDSIAQKHQALLHASNSESAGKKIQGLGSGGRSSDEISEKVSTEVEEGGVVGKDPSAASSRESQLGVPSDDWPLFKIGQPSFPGKEGIGLVKWPGAGWRGEKKDDPGSILEKFEKNFR